MEKSTAVKITQTMIYFTHATITSSCIIVGGGGLEPPEPKGNRFTVCPATNYGIPTHIKGD